MLSVKKEHNKNVNKYGQASPDDIKKAFELPKNYEFLRFEQYRLKPFECQQESVVFFMWSANYVFDFDRGTVIQAHGSLNDKSSTPISIQMHGFDPYFYFKVPDSWFPQGKLLNQPRYGVDIAIVRDYIYRLKDIFLDYVENTPTDFYYEKKIIKSPKYKEPIKEWSITTADELMGFHGKDPSVFIKITTHYPKFVKLFRDLIENPYGRKSYESKFGDSDSGYKKRIPEVPGWLKPPRQGGTIPSPNIIKTYEADVDFIIRWITETKRAPCQWFYIPRGLYSNVSGNFRFSKIGLEINVKHNNLIPIIDCDKYIPPQNKYIHNQILKDIAPNKPSDYENIFPNFKCFTWDIESLTDPTHFADPNKDPVLQISIVLSDLFKKHKRKRILLALDYTPKPSNVDIIYCFKTEKELIEAFQNIYVDFDPDIDCGHNIMHFDYKYVNKRAQIFNLVDKFYNSNRKKNMNLGRTKDGYIQSTTSEVRGFKKTNTIIPGRMIFDILRFSQGMIPPRKENKLDALARDFLGETKEDFPYELIAQSQKTAQGRERMGRYCMKDSDLTEKLLFKLNCILTQMKICYISKVFPQTCMNGGQERKVDGGVRYESIPEPGDTKSRRILKMSGKYYIKRRETDDDNNNTPNAQQADTNNNNNQQQQAQAPTVTKEKKKKKEKAKLTKPSEISAAIRKKGIFSYISLHGHEEHEFSPDDDYDNDDESDYDDNGSYTGATVIPPKRGFYAQVRMNIFRKIAKCIVEGGDVNQIEEVKNGEFVINREKHQIRDTKRSPGCTLDFSGMYPGIQMRKNICWSTLVEKKSDLELYGLTKDDIWQVPDYKDGENGEVEFIENPNNPIFVKPHIKVGIIPQMQRKLKNFRGVVKVKMGQCKRLKNSLYLIQKAAMRLLYLGQIKNQNLDVDDEKKNKDEYTYIESIRANNQKKKEKYNEYIQDLLKECAKLFGGEDYQDIEPFKKTLEDIFAEASELCKQYETYLDDASFNFNSDIITKLNGIVDEALALEKKYAFLEDVHDATQNGIKAWMNSVYGKSGDKNSPYHIKEVAGSVTDTGRVDIRLTKVTTTKVFNRKNGYPFDSDVIYGDTDSIFVYMDGLGMLCDYDATTGEVNVNVSEVDSYGQQMAGECNKHFEAPTKLEYEKAWLNLILIEKKNYSYDKHIIGNPDSKIDIKGIETIKRGPPLFIRNIGNAMLDKICMKSDIDGAIRDYIEAKRKLRNGDVQFTDLIYMKKLSKDPSSYKIREKKGAVKVQYKHEVDDDDDDDDKKKKKKKKRKRKTIADNTPVLAIINKKMKRDETYEAEAGDIVKWIVIDAAKTMGDYKANTYNISSRVEDPMYVIENNIPIYYPEYERHLDSVFFKIIKEVIVTLSGYEVEKNKNSTLNTKKQMKLDDIIGFKKVSSEEKELNRLQDDILSEFDNLNLPKQKKQQLLNAMNDTKNDNNEIDDIIDEDVSEIIENRRAKRRMNTNYDQIDENQYENEEGENLLLEDLDEEEEEAEDFELLSITHKLKTLLKKQQDIKQNGGDSSFLKRSIRTLWLYKKKKKSDIEKEKRQLLQSKIALVKKYVQEHYGDESKGLFTNSLESTTSSKNIDRKFGLFNFIKSVYCILCKETISEQKNNNKHVIVEYDHYDKRKQEKEEEDDEEDDEEFFKYKLVDKASDYIRCGDKSVIICQKCADKEKFKERMKKDVATFREQQKEFDKVWEACMKCTDGFVDGILNCNVTSCPHLGHRLSLAQKKEKNGNNILKMVDIAKNLQW